MERFFETVVLLVMSPNKSDINKMTILSRILIMDVSLQTVLPCLISAYCQEERRIGPNMSKDWQLRVDLIQAFNFMLGNWCPGKLHKRITRGQGASPYQVFKPTMLPPWG